MRAAHRSRFVTVFIRVNLVSVFLMRKKVINSGMLCLVFCFLCLQAFLPFSTHVSFHTNAKNICQYKVGAVSLLPPDTSYMCRAQPVEVLSLQSFWSSETKIKKKYPYVITLYLVVGTSCAIPSAGISLSFL